MKLIVARDENNGIGFNNSIPWKCKEDLQWFKKCTKDGTVVMGRNTFESLGKKPLPNRHNIVITSTPELLNHIESDSLEFMTLNTYITKNRNTSHWLIGGASLYKTLLPCVEEVYETTISGHHNCDTFLDVDFGKGFNEIAQFKLSDNAFVTNYWKKDE